MTGIQHRKDAIELSEDSNWKGLQKLVEDEPLAAHQVDDYGMLPLHWACTEQDVPQGLVYSLLKAYPQAPAVFNKGKLLPLHIAIKAHAKPQWIQALLAAYPESILVMTPTGERPLVLAEKFEANENVLVLLQEAERNIQTFDHQRSDDIYNPNVASTSTSRNSKISPKQGVINARSVSTPLVDADIPIEQQRFSYRSTSSEPSTRATRRTSTNSNGNGTFIHPTNEECTTTTNTRSEVPFNPPCLDAASICSSVTSVNYHVSKPLPQHVAKKLSTRTVVSLPPRWTNALTCHICLAKFSPFRKRHHCRNCGQAICSEHSAKSKIPLYHFGLKDGQRVCVVCFDQLKSNSYHDSETKSFDMDYGITTSSLPSRPNSDSRLQRHVSEPVYYNGLPCWKNEELLAAQMDHIRLDSKSTSDRDKVDVSSRSVASMNPKRSGKYEFHNNRLVENTANSTVENNRYTGESTDILTGMHSLSTPSDSLSQSSSIVGSPLSFHQDSGKPPPSPRTPSIPNMPSPSKMEEYHTSFKLGSGMQQGHFTNDSLSDLPHVVSDLNTPTNGTTPTSIASPLDGAPSSVGTPLDDLSSGLVDDSSDIEGDGQDPEVDTLVNLGLAMLKKGSCSGAVAAFNRAIEIRPMDASLYLNLGKALYADDDLEGAVAAIRHSLQLQPSAATSTYLGRILFEKGDHDEAIQAYQQSLEIQRDDKVALSTFQ